MNNKKPKYIFVTGGVLSGLGKGITAASIGNMLKDRGLQVNMQKFDQYINVDAGTLNPAEHGEDLSRSYKPRTARRIFRKNGASDSACNRRSKAPCKTFCNERRL